MSLKRHLAVLKDAWKEENARRRAGVKDWREKEFLPAALEISETPPSPIGRAILWTIIAAALIALAWSIFSFVDVVAVGEGRLVPTGRLRSVEAAEAGVIRAIDVREGPARHGGPAADRAGPHLGRRRCGHSPCGTGFGSSDPRPCRRDPGLPCYRAHPVRGPRRR